MAEYPKQHIEKHDAQAAKEGWPLTGSFVIAMLATAVLLYIVGLITNSIL